MSTTAATVHDVTNSTFFFFFFSNDTDNTTYQPDLSNSYILSWYFQLFYIVIFILMVLVASGGNSIVIWIVVAHRRMRTVTNYFLVNLAVADILISLLNTLFNFIYMLHHDWQFGRHYCKFCMFISTCSISASVFTFMAIAIDRYVAIVHPLQPRMSAGRVLGFILMIWIISSLVALPNLMYADTYTYSDGHSICYLVWTEETDFIYNLCLIVFNYFVPLGALMLTYTRVGRTLWGSRAIGECKNVAQLKSKRRVVKMMVAVVLIFAVCWLPQHVYFLAASQSHAIKNYRFAQQTYLAIFWLAMSNSMYNPIIYCWMNKKFREGFKFVFRWFPCVRNSNTSNTLFGPPAIRTQMSMSEKTQCTSFNRIELTINNVNTDGHLSRHPLVEKHTSAPEDVI